MNLFSNQSFIVYNFFKYKSIYSWVFSIIVLFTLAISFSYFWVINFSEDFKEIVFLENKNSIKILALDKNQNQTEIISEQLNNIQNNIRKHEKNIDSISVRIKLEGIASNKGLSTIFNGIGIQPIRDKQILEKRLKIIQGEFFENYEQEEVLISEDIANKLNLKVGDMISLSIKNYNQHFFEMQGKNFSSINLYVKGIFKDILVANKSDYSNNFILMPFYPAGKLLYTSSVSEVIVSFLNEKSKQKVLNNLKSDITNIKIQQELLKKEEIDSSFSQHDNLIDNFGTPKIVEVTDKNNSTSDTNQKYKFLQNLTIVDTFSDSINQVTSSLSHLWTLFVIILSVIYIFLSYFAISLLFTSRKDEVTTLMFYNWNFGKIIKMFSIEIIIFNILTFIFNLILIFITLSLIQNFSFYMFFVDSHFNFENIQFSHILIITAFVSILSIISSLISLHFIKNKIKPEEL